MAAPVFRPCPDAPVGDTDGPTVTDALLLLGQLCLDRGTDSREQAVEWFRSAARGGDARAINMLGRCYQRGWGVQVDLVRAAAYFRKAADLGDAWALFNLGDMHLRGDGVAQDDEAAFLLYAQAARLGHGKALNMLGLLHESGRGAPINIRHARTYYQAAAESGDCWGQFNHARMLIETGDLTSAVPWLNRALDSGFPDFHRAMADALDGHPDPHLRSLAEQARHRAFHGNDQ